MDLDFLGGVVVGVLLQPQIGRYLADDVAHDRRNDLTCQVAHPARVVQHNEHLDFGVVHGQHGGKAHLLVVVAVTAQRAVGSLGGAGLAADAVARHIGVAVGVSLLAVTDGFLHHRKQLGADFLGDDLTADVGFGLGHHVARLIGDFIHHIGRDQIPAVGDCRHRRCHLQRGDGLVLTKRRRVQVGVHVCHLLGIVDVGPAGFVGQVNAGGLGEAERLDIVVENRGLQGLRRLDKPDVAAVVQRLRHILQAVGVAQGAVVGVLVFFGILVDGQLAAAVEFLLGGHHAGIQPGCRRDQLEHRAGDVQLGNVFVFPLGFAQHTLQAGVLAADGVAVLVQCGFGADAPVRHNVRDLLFAQAALQPLDVVVGQPFVV